MNRCCIFWLLVFFTACRAPASSSPSVPKVAGGASPSPGGGAGAVARASLPLVLLTDTPLPGPAVRFDYEDLDVAKGHLVIAHMNDASVIVVKSSDGSLVKVLPGIPRARGVVVADEVGRIFVTSSPNKLVIIDNDSLALVARVDTGHSPDGVGWDPIHKIVGVSDQGDGAISLISDAGSGTRRPIRLGAETGNVVFDPSRKMFWITVVQSSPPDQLIAVDPVMAQVARRIELPGCDGAHGLRIHPDGNSALVACEGNSKVARVDLDANHALELAPSGRSPDVLAIDPGLDWLYVAAESGDLKVFDLSRSGLVNIDTERVAPASHSVAVDAATHRVFFPLLAGPNGTPVLRIMRPAGT
ncbi:MAG: hypothetical protein ABJB12_04165 [Pseudomonadota bacterium]